MSNLCGDNSRLTDGIDRCTEYGTIGNSEWLSECWVTMPHRLFRMDNSELKMSSFKQNVFSFCCQDSRQMIPIAETSAARAIYKQTYEKCIDLP